MKKDEIYTEWQKLCDEHEAARDAYLYAFSTMNKKFTTITNSVSHDNPSADDLLLFDKTWATWEDVRQRMHEFVKQHA